MNKISQLKYACMKISQNWGSLYWWTKGLPIYLLGLIYFKKICGNKGIYVMAEDWDNLIVLDACRYDYFIETTGLNVACKISRGSHTVEFVKENFTGKQYRDTVMVSANPHVDLWAKDSFFKLIPVWKTGWDDEINTVLPQTMVENAVAAENKYPDKRLIVWFMQPHMPFIENPELSPLGYKRDCEIIGKGRVGKIPQEYFVTPWKEADRNRINIDDVWKAYRRNLEIVLPYAFELAKELKGKTVITSDHGNAFRRLKFPLPVRIAGHEISIYIPELIQVPWLEMESPKRKEINAGTITEKGRARLKARKLKRYGKL